MTPTQELVAKTLQQVARDSRPLAQATIEDVIRALADAFEERNPMSFDWEEFVSYAMKGWEA